MVMCPVEVRMPESIHCSCVPSLKANAKISNAPPITITAEVSIVRLN